eukprot:gene844-7317_t
MAKLLSAGSLAPPPYAAVGEVPPNGPLEEPCIPYSDVRPPFIKLQLNDMYQKVTPLISAMKASPLNEYVTRLDAAEGKLQELLDLNMKPIGETAGEDIIEGADIYKFVSMMAENSKFQMQQQKGMSAEQKAAHATRVAKAFGNRPMIKEKALPHFVLACEGGIMQDGKMLSDYGMVGGKVGTEYVDEMSAITSDAAILLGSYFTEVGAWELKAFPTTSMSELRSAIAETAVLKEKALPPNFAIALHCGGCSWKRYRKGDADMQVKDLPEVPTSWRIEGNTA